MNAISWEILNRFGSDKFVNAFSDEGKRVLAVGIVVDDLGSVLFWSEEVVFLIIASAVGASGGCTGDCVCIGSTKLDFDQLKNYNCACEV